MLKDTLAPIPCIAKLACAGTGRQALYDRLHPENISLISERPYWARLQAELIQPLEAQLRAAEPDEAGEQLQQAVAAAEALATRPCAHPGCATIVGPSEAAAPRGKRCGGCRLVRYCGPACQKADWKGHKAACRELQRREQAQAAA